MNRRPFATLIFLSLVPVLAFPGAAAVRLPALLSDHMVLQRDGPVRIWGWADPGEVVHVSFQEQHPAATADSAGRWEVFLKPLRSGASSEMIVSASNRIVIHDVLVGEVWVASGQSNMEMQLRLAQDGEREIARSNYPGIRLFEVERRVADAPSANAGGSWRLCSPESARVTSAVGFFFARDLHRAIRVPVGLIHASWRGSAAQPWISRSALKSEPKLRPYLDDWVESLARYPQAIEEWKNAPSRSPRKAAGPGDAPSPSGLYNAMVAPLTPYRIRGVIWYQGESNAENEADAYLYRSVFPVLIEDWRSAWRQGDFPFLFVQLANMTDRPWWPLLRESQSKALKLRNTAVAFTIDVGDPQDGHPKNKQPVGARLALAARAVAYGERIEYSGPAFREVTREGDALRVWFDHIGSGLMVKGPKLSGFLVAGTDGRFVAAEATIEGSSVVVRSAGTPVPTAVRYAWADNPGANLYNREGLPAGPFRTDAGGAGDSPTR